MPLDSSAMIDAQHQSQMVYFETILDLSTIKVPNREGIETQGMAKRLHLIATEKGLAAVLPDTLCAGKVILPSAVRCDSSHPILQLAVKEIEAYFAGILRSFEVPLDPLGGTLFQNAVWKSLQRIPFGEKVTYGYQAAVLLNKPQAVRAVASANSRNPLGIIIPCHRVVSASGDLAGYSGGISMKKFLLDHESITSRSG